MPEADTGELSAQTLASREIITSTNVLTASTLWLGAAFSLCAGGTTRRRQGSWTMIIKDPIV